MEVIELAKKELLTCKKDPLYFISKYIQIEEAGGNIHFPLYPKQADVVTKFLKDHYIIILKSRQIGISTVVQALLVYLVLFHSNTTIGVISRDGPEATDFVRKTKLMVDTLPKFLRPKKYKKETQQSFELTNGSRIISAPVNLTNPDATLRGKTITTLVMDEAAFIRHVSEAYSGMIPAVFKAHQTAKAKHIPYGIIVISTPNRTTGIGEWYFKQWKEAIEHKSIFTPLKIHYSAAPFATKEWIEQQKKLLKDPVVIAQELELSFGTSKDALFDDTELVKKLAKTQDPIKTIPVKYFSKFGNMNVIGSGDWNIWKEPDMKKHYLIGADIASITGACESAIEVTDMDLVQVAEFSGKLRIKDFEKEILKIAEQYNNSTVIVEANSYGSRTVETLAENPDIASKLFYTRITDPKTGKITKILPGLYTTSKTRPLMYEALYWIIAENPERILSDKLALELQGINREFKSSTLSDMVMAYAFICYVRKYEDKYLSVELNDSQKDILNSILDLHGNFYEEDNRQNKEEKDESFEDTLLDLMS